MDSESDSEINTNQNGELDNSNSLDSDNIDMYPESKKTTKFIR